MITIDNKPILDVLLDSPSHIALWMMTGAFFTILFIMIIEVLEDVWQRRKLKWTLVDDKPHYPSPQPLPTITSEQLAACMEKYLKIMEKDKPRKKPRKRTRA